MTRNIITGLIIFLVLPSVLVQCKSKSELQPQFNKSGFYVVETDHSNKSLAILTDGNLSTNWVSKDNLCKQDFLIVFKKPEFVKDLTIENSADGNKKYSRIKSIKLVAFKEKNPYDEIFGDHVRFDLKNQVENNLQMNKALMGSIFAISCIKLSIDECYENNKEFSIDEIKVNYGHGENMINRLTVSAIKNIYGANDKAWFIEEANDGGKDTFINVLSDLAYSALNGNEEAEHYLYAYSPKGAMSGEMRSYIVSWYNQTKQVMNK